MTTITILLLLVTAASTIAFSPPAELVGPETGDRVVMDDFGQPRFLVRRRRDIPAASKSGAGAGSFASSSSGSGSTSGSLPGYAGFGARSGFDGAQGYNGVNPGGIAFPGANDYQNYGFGAQNPYNQYGGAGYVPVDFNALFQQYIAFMQRLAQQQAYAANYYTPDAFVNNYDNTVPGGYNDSPAPDFSDINSRAGFADYGGASGFAFPGATNFGGSGGEFGGSPSDGSPVSASASASLGPRGGFGSASISPPPQGNPELGTRMGSLPASNGDNFSVFTSSSSSSSDLNGMKKSSKEATSVINDNGKVSTYHVSDP